MTWAPVPGTPRVVLTPEEEQRWRQWYASQPPVAARLPAALEQYRAFRANQQAGLGEGDPSPPIFRGMLLYGGLAVLGYGVSRMAVHYLKPHMPKPQEPWAEIAAMPIGVVTSIAAGLVMFHVLESQ